MITSWQIYWITRLDGLVTISVAASMLLSIAVVSLLTATIVTYVSSNDDNWSESYRTRNRKYFILWRKICLISVPFLIISVLSANMIPTTKEFAAIYMIPKIANNEQVQKVPDNALKLLNSKLEQWISETYKEHKKK